MLVVLVLLAAGGGRVSGCHSRSGEDAERVGVGGHVSPRVSHVSRVQVYSHQGTEPTFEKEEAAAVARGSEDAGAGGEEPEHVREEGEMKVTLGNMSRVPCRSVYLVVLQKSSIRSFVIAEKASTRAFSWLNALSPLSM